MNKYKLEIEMLSDTLIGSGEGFGAIIDSDIVFDELGIPYIPAKRVKGLLRDSVRNVLTMMNAFTAFTTADENKLFGKPGMEVLSPIKLSDLYIENYEHNFQWIKYFTKSNIFNTVFSKDSVIDFFTNIRRSTTIDENGIAMRHSLRTVRVLNKGYKFLGEIEVQEDNSEFEKLLTLACVNLKSMGTKRNRGLGEIKCSLFKEGENLNEKLLIELEALCKE